MSQPAVLCFSIDEEIQLRLHEEQYAEEYFALIESNRAYLREWMPWAASEGSLEETKAYMKQTLLQFANNEEVQLGIWYQNGLVGAFGYTHLDWTNQKVEIGYWIDGSLQGKGLVTKVCRAMVSYAFDHYHLNKVEILCATGNRRSRAIPERLGFTQEGVIRQGERFNDHYNDLVVYGMLASEWSR
ncbi:MAG TPA: GNAT family protein [Ktedonobacteraceae bacterium]|nr:GNAT family protein [Ktedonobacteraceae bacterium]